MFAFNGNDEHGGLTLQASGAPAMFTLGLEYTDLLVRTLSELPPGDAPEDRRVWVSRRLAACVAAVDAHLRVISVTTTRVAAERGVSFGGLDSSAAPSKDCSSITDVFRLLGIPSFGAAGTLEVAALLTRGIFRALGEGIMPRAGFSGLSTFSCLAAWRDSRCESHLSPPYHSARVPGGRGPGRRSRSSELRPACAARLLRRLWHVRGGEKGVIGDAAESMRASPHACLFVQWP